MINNNTIEKVRTQVSVRDVISEFATLQNSGSNIVCCCPLHNEKTPSLHISRNLNTWHCFGCGEGGDAITFIRKKLGYSFPDAVRYLAGKHNIPIEETQQERTAEQKRQDDQREAMLAAYEVVQKYFVSNLRDNTPEAVQAYEYATERWGQDFVSEAGLGYAFDSFNALQTFAKKAALSTEILSEMGLIKKNDNGRTYDFFRGRIMIPIRDRFGRVIGYTARTMSEDASTPKYLNTCNNLLYQKDRSVFGIDVAIRQAAKDNLLYLVEGAPDVLRLQSIGILNVVASLGSDWTDNQFQILTRYTRNICFLPDADTHRMGELGTGIKKVMKSGAHALELGFKVTVREIPQGENGKKHDPDSYCKTRSALMNLEEEDFILWYTRHLLALSGDTEPSVQIIEQVATLVSHSDKEHERNLYIDKLTKLTSGRSTWNKAVRAALQKKETEKILRNSGPNNQDLLERYGFQQIDNRYVSLSAEGEAECLGWHSAIAKRRKGGGTPSARNETEGL